MDPETASIRSEAPSYTSTAADPPTYSQVVPPPNYTIGGSPGYSSLVSPSQGPGQPSTHHGLPPTADPIRPGTHSYLTEITPGGRPMQSAMYQRVAARRAAKAMNPALMVEPSSSRRRLPDSDDHDEERQEEDEEDALAQEGKDWDFMMSQMKDRDDREVKWKKFKEGYHRERFHTGWGKSGGYTKGLRQGK